MLLKGHTIFQGEISPSGRVSTMSWGPAGATGRVEDPAVVVGGVTDRADGVGLESGGGVTTVVAPPPQPAIVNVHGNTTELEINPEPVTVMAVSLTR
jgi:hypothetical protein